MRIIDFMRAGRGEHDIVRIVEGLEGEVPMHGDLSVRFGYGKLVPWVRRPTGTSHADLRARRARVRTAPCRSAPTSTPRVGVELRGARRQSGCPSRLTTFRRTSRPADGRIDAEAALAATP